MRIGNFLSLAMLASLPVTGALAEPPPQAGMIGYHGRLLRARDMHFRASAARPHVQGSAVASFTFLDFPGTSYTAVYGINPGAKATARTLLTGSFGPGVADQGSSAEYGFALQLKSAKGVMSENYRTILPDQSSIFPGGVNDSGAIAGQLYNFGGASSGFLLAPNGAFTSIVVPYPPADNTVVNSLNNKGVVVGAYYTSGASPAYGFEWKNGAFSQLPSYPGSTYTWPYSINSAGDTAGDLIDQNGVTHGYLFQGNSFTLIDPPGSVYTLAIGVNDSDEVVGFYCTTLQDCSIAGPEDIHGFVYSNGTYTTLDVPGSPFTELDSVNDAGQIAGNYVDQNGLVHSFLVTP